MLCHCHRLPSITLTASEKSQTNALELWSLTYHAFLNMKGKILAKFNVEEVLPYREVDLNSFKASILRTIYSQSSKFSEEGCEKGPCCKPVERVVGYLRN